MTENRQKSPIYKSSPNSKISGNNVSKRKKPSRPLEQNEEVTEHVDREYITTNEDGEKVIEKKRKRIIKKTTIAHKYLTLEQKEEIDNAFFIFDRDRSGSIDISELKDALKALGIYLDKNEVKAVMTKVDKDGSGSIDQEEFLSMMAE